MCPLPTPLGAALRFNLESFPGSFRSLVISIHGRFGPVSFRYGVISVPGRIRSESFRSRHFGTWSFQYLTRFITPSIGRQSLRQDVIRRLDHPGYSVPGRFN